MMEGFISYTTGSGGTWIAWHTPTEPPANATGRDMMAGTGPVHFAIGATADDALAKLRADHPLLTATGRTS
jgi:hypothetical protein